MTEAIWIKDPMAILADGAERGVVVKDGAIVELVPKGREPATAAAPFRIPGRTRARTCNVAMIKLLIRGVARSERQRGL